MKEDKVIKIAIVGPESTGKSTITMQLANHYETSWVPEYAREYCKNLNREYSLEDEMNIFHGQLASERKMTDLVTNNLLFCDTTVLTVKIWCDHLFGTTPKPVLNYLKEQMYDFYVLMDIDLPWQDDKLRDFPTLREHFMKVWHQELQVLNAQYKVVSGLGQERFQNALAAVDLFLSNRL